MNKTKDTVNQLRSQPTFPLRKDGQPRSAIARWLIKHTQYNSDVCLTPPFRKEKDGRQKMRFNGGETTASRVMCWLVYGPPPSDNHEALHSCGEGHSGCCNPVHLRWGTHKENGQDMVAHGRSTQGTKHAAAKLTDEKVRLIRRRVRSGVMQKDVATEMGVCRSVVCEIVNGKAWGHVQ